jgi:hypothetical protein
LATRNGNHELGSSIKFDWRPAYRRAEHCGTNAFDGIRNPEQAERFLALALHDHDVRADLATGLQALAHARSDFVDDVWLQDLTVHAHD